MSVRESVSAELEALGATGWRRELALALAEKVDGEGQAAAARELRVLMTALGSDEVAAEPSATDDLRAQREKRRADAIRAAGS